MIERRRSKISGWGVYATRPITKNTRIVSYDGEKITHKESRDREARYLDKGQIWCFTLNNRWVIDAHVGGSVARYINHCLQAQLLLVDQGRRDLDPRRAQHQDRRRAQLRLQHHWQRRDPLSVPARL